MIKHRGAGKYPNNVIPWRRHLNPTLVIALALSFLVTGALLANRRGFGSAGGEHSKSSGSDVSIQSFSPGSPSKEFIYAGSTGRIIATEEPTCSYSIAPTGSFFSLMGGDGSVNLTATTGCTWTVTSNLSWLPLTSAGSGSGSDVVTFAVRENFTGAARQGTITIAGLTHTVTQNGGASCTYDISPTFANFGASGGTGSLGMTAAGGCAWQAVSSASWVTVTSGCCGIGNGTVAYSVGVNGTGTGRNGTITIGGEEFTVKQTP